MNTKKILFGILFSLILLSPAFAVSSISLEVNTADPRLFGVYAVSDTTLTAVGTEGVVTKSTDRGVTWSSSTLGTAIYTWYGVFFPTSTVGYIAGNKSETSSYIYKTTDGGSTWVLNHTNGVTDGFFDIYFADANTGWAVGRNVVSPPVRVYRTTNGTDWSSVELSWSPTALGVFAKYDSAQGSYRVWVAGGDGNISRSNDGGATFSNQTSGTTQSLIDLFFIDKDTGWMVGGNGTILTTSNGGGTWTAQTSGVTVQLNGVHFVSSTTGFVVGNGGTILSTTNGGTTWTAETSGTTADLYDIYFYDAYNGWAVGGNSRVALIREEANVSSFSQSTGTQGSTVTVTIQGTGFKAGMTPIFSGSGITVTSTTITSATEMSVTFTIAAGAATGARNLILTTAAGNVLTFSNRFTVTSSSVTNPTVTSTSQSILSVGNTYDLVITGTGFLTGATMTINGITPNSLTVDSSTQITANVTVPTGHDTGLFNITVTNTDGGAGTLANGITIASSSGGPTVTELVTAYGYKGTVATVVVNGTGFANNSQVLFSGSGVTGTATYISSTQLRVAVTIASDATAGSRTVTVFNPTDSSVGALENAFTVKTSSTSGKVIINVVIGPNPVRRGTNVVNIQGEAMTAPLTLDIPIFDSTGRMLARLSRNITQPGRFTIPWNTLTDNMVPGEASNGLHMVSINTLGSVQQRAKVVIAR